MKIKRKLKTRAVSWCWYHSCLGALVSPSKQEVWVLTAASLLETGPWACSREDFRIKTTLWSIGFLKGCNFTKIVENKRKKKKKPLISIERWQGNLSWQSQQLFSRRICRKFRPWFFPWIKLPKTWVHNPKLQKYTGDM